MEPQARAGNGTWTDAHLRVLLDSTDMGIYGVDRQGRCTFINRPGAELLGYAPGELLGHHMHEQIHNRRADGSPYPLDECAIHRSLIAGQPVHRRDEFLWRRDGTGFPAEFSSFPIVENGEVTGTVVTFRDVSAQRQIERQHDRVLNRAQAAEAYYRSLFNGTDDAILIADERGQYVDANEAAVTLLGYDRDELVGMSVGDLVDDRWEPSEFRQLLSQGSWSGSVELRRKDGSLVPVDVRTSMVDLPGGQATIARLTDITERARAEHQLREDARIIETLYRVGRMLSAEMDLQKVVQATTDAGTALTGAQFGAFFYNVVNEQGESYTLYTLSGVPREAFEKFPMPRNTLIFGPTFRGERIMRLDDVTKDPRYGKNQPYNGMPEGHLPVRSYLAVPVISRSGEVLGGLFFGHSRPGVFTEQHERIIAGVASQAAIAIDNAQLLRSAQQAARMREEFLSIAAHELKTPLTTVKGYTQMLRRELSRPALNEKRLSSIAEQLEKQTGRFEELIGDLLDITRLQLRRLELRPEPVDLGELAHEVVSRFEHATERTSGHRLRLEVPTPVVGLWDPGRIDQVLSNLVSNALKYSPEGGEILVRVTRGEDEAEIMVRDTGIGIADADQTDLFQPFHRANSARAQVSGVGLGLYITRLIVDRHGGTIDVASRTGAGSTFTVRLPLETPRADEADGLAAE